MSFLGEEYDVATDLPESDRNYKSIPAAWYPAAIKVAELKDSKKGGKGINLQWVVEGDNYAERVIFQWLNIKNASLDAERIGRQQLGDVARAGGLAKVRDTDQLVGIHALIKVARTKDEEYGDEDGFKNEVKAVKARDGAALPTAAAKGSGEVVDEAAGSKPPWAK